MSEYLEFLNVKVIQENKPVTYKSLARSLGIHVNTAKQALYDFSKKAENIHAVYCVTGISLHYNQFKIQLVNEPELEEAKSNYKEITGVHVYSVTSFTPNDFSIFYTAYEDAPKLAIEDRVKCGILKNDHVIVKEVVSNRRSNGPQTPAPAKPAPAKTSSTFTPKPKEEPKPAPKRKGTLNFGPATTKKQATEQKPKVEKPAPKSTPKPTPKPTPKAAPKSAVKKDNDHDNIAARMAKTSIKASDIFSDDDEEEEEEEAKPQPVEDLKNEEDDDIEMEDTEPVKEEPEQAATPSKSRKKVLKKKTTRNARGFLVTEEVWEFESGDEEEPAPAPVKKSATPSKTPAKKTAAPKKPTNQANLFSFFKKV